MACFRDTPDFDRDGPGLLTFKQVLKTGVGGVTGLGGAHGVAISTDGAHVYSTASVDDAVVVFARDLGADPIAFGRLTEIQVEPNLGGLDRAIGVAVSREPDGLGSRNVYVTGHTSDALVVYRRHLRDYPSHATAAAAHVGAGLVQLEQLGQVAPAYQHFLEALDLGPDAETAARARAALARIAALQKYNIGRPRG